MNLFNLFHPVERVKTLLVPFLSLILIFSLVLVSCEEDENGDSDDTKDQFEPNNSWQEAYSVSLDKNYDAVIGEEDDVDFFIFTTDHPADAFDVVALEFTNVGEDMKVCVEIFDENGQSLASAHSGTAGADWTYNITCPGGTYIIKVHGDDGWEKYTGAYSFKISNQGSNDEYSPNHSFESAAQVNIGNDIQGKIISNSEEDFFVFTNDVTSYWREFNLAFTNVSSEYKVKYEIFDVGNNSIASGSGSGKGADVSHEFPEKTEKIYVKVWGYDYFENTKGSYTLNLSVSDPNDDNEPDDTFADARNIDSYPTDITGTIVGEAANDNGGDYEFFKVSVNAGKKVEFTVDPQASNTEMHFHIYNSDESYTGNNVDGSDGETLNYYLNNSSTEDAVLYIKLGAFVGDNGDYTISFTETTAD